MHTTESSDEALEDFISDELDRTWKKYVDQLFELIFMDIVIGPLYQDIVQQNVI